MKAKHRTPETVVLPEAIGRDCNAVECPSCGGFAPEAHETTTRAEIRDHQTCGRKYACCLRAYRCNRCFGRIIARLHAPDMG